MILDIFYNVFQGAIALFLCYFGIKGLWVSTMMLEERKARYRAGTHDYYDNPIEKDED